MVLLEESRHMGLALRILKSQDYFKFAFASLLKIECMVSVTLKCHAFLQDDIIFLLLWNLRSQINPFLCKLPWPCFIIVTEK